MTLAKQNSKPKIQMKNYSQIQITIIPVHARTVFRHVDAFHDAIDPLQAILKEHRLRGFYERPNFVQPFHSITFLCNNLDSTGNGRVDGNVATKLQRALLKTPWVAQVEIVGIDRLT